MLEVTSPYSVFFGKDGNPLEDGYVYIGTENLNPETNPISVYWDESGSQPAAQPLRTSGGYIVRNGTPAQIFCSVNYSITVRDKKGNLVYYKPSNGFSNPTDYVDIVRDYDADPTGTTNSVRAINFALRSGKPVHIPKGTFLIQPDTTPGTFVGDFMLYIGSNGSDPLLQSNLNGLLVFGDGNQSILKLGDNVGRNKLLFGAGTGDSLASMTFRNFAIDLNGQNNLQTSFTDPLRYNSAFYLYCPCVNMTFDGLYITNVSGSQGVRIGNDTAAGYGTNIKVQNCRINNFGIGIPNNYQQDVSVFYIQADGILCENNWFQNSDFTFDLSRGHTAFELHGDTSTIVTNNRFTYTQMPVLIVSSAKVNSNVIVDGNVFHECNYMASLDPAQYDQKRVTISNNIFNSTKAAGSAIIPLGNSTEPAKTRENIVITGNTITCWGNANHNVDLIHIDSHYLRSIFIENNDVNGLPGCLLYFAGVVMNSLYCDITIKNNRLDSLGNVGGAVFPTAPSFILVDPLYGGTINSLTIDGNQLFNSAGKDYSALGCFRVGHNINFLYIDNTESAVTSAYPEVTESSLTTLFKRVDAYGWVKFPAVQVPSTDPNVLDDYEEGTWTPTLTTDGVDFTSVTYSARSGKYTKIGNVVHFSLLIQTLAITVGGATGNLRISGLPYTSSADAARAAPAIGTALSWNVNNPSGCDIQDANTVINLTKRTAANGASSDMVVADAATGASANYLRVSGSYFSNQ